VRPVSCNTWIRALNVFCGWLHEQGHSAEGLKLKTLRVEKRLIVTLDEARIRGLLTFKGKTFNQQRVQTLVCALLDTGCRVGEMLSARVVDCDTLVAAMYLTCRRLGPEPLRYRYVAIFLGSGFANRLPVSLIICACITTEICLQELHMLIIKLLDYYSYVVLLSVILTWFPVSGTTLSLVKLANSLTEPVLRPIRNALPQGSKLDWAPLILVIGLQFLKNLIDKGLLS
jgi:YggT family protein